MRWSPRGRLITTSAPRRDDLATFVYPSVTYGYSREWEVVFEDRPGIHCARTRRGVAYVTRTSNGVNPLALALALEPPAVAGWS